MQLRTLLILILSVSSALASPTGQTYTYETISTYGEYTDRAVRWSSGTVKIYDQTGLLEKYPDILETFNVWLNNTKLVLLDPKDKNLSDIEIIWVPELPAPYNTACATSQSKLGLDNSTITAGTIRVRKRNECLDLNDKSMIIHELGHALGFSRHAKENDVMGTHDPNYEYEIPVDTLRRFLTGLYTLEAGQPIPRDREMPQPRGEASIPGLKERKLEIKEDIKKESPVHIENTYQPVQSKYRKIETILPGGKVKIEFVEVK